jgi:putative peptide zinc metalloprotease protein
VSGASIHSPLWHRIEAMKPRLRRNIAVERHVIRGQVWYVTRERLTNRAHRFSPAVHFMLMRMDGTRTFDAIWREAVDHFGEDAPSQDQILRTASQLYLADVLHSDAAVDERELGERAGAERNRLTASNLRNPMFLRFPLLDPDRFLNATVHLVRPFCGWLGGAAWLLAIAWLASEMFAHWDELTADMADRVLAAQSLLTILLVYPLLKILHEFGHAYATKLADEEVHEMGIMLLTFLPAPYVDASASALVPGKWRRAGIAAAGMIVELAVAALAMAVWLTAQPGLVRSIAYDTLFIASVSTLLFNGNPLLRFDAYYILSDLIEIPNLGSRAQRYYQYLAQKYLFGVEDARNPATARGESLWFAFYAPASFAYRLFTLFGISLFVASKYFFVGVALTVWMLASALLWPLVKAGKFILVSPELAGRRFRAGSAAALCVATLALLVAVLPFPSGTVARGVVWIPDESRIVAEASGNLVRFVAAPGQRVAHGEAIAILDDPFAAARQDKARARLAEIDARLLAAEAHSPYDAEVLRRQRDLARQELADMDRRADDLTLRAPHDGLFVAPHAADLRDNFIKRGDTIGYVMDGGPLVLRAAVPSAEFEMVRDRTQSVSARFEDAPWTRVDGMAVAREAPQATHLLPAAAFSAANGGPFVLDPSAKDKDVMLESAFEVDVRASELVAQRWGDRVWVRFDHGGSPLIGRFYRYARQLFLGRFHV